jgi:hypothetical protein
VPTDGAAIIAFLYPHRDDFIGLKVAAHGGCLVRSSGDGTPTGFARLHTAVHRAIETMVTATVASRFLPLVASASVISTRRGGPSATSRRSVKRAQQLSGRKT